MQGELEAALRTVLRHRRLELAVAGRTDAGVHAIGQVASHAGAPASARSLNGILPADLRVLASEPAPDEFDARRDAVGRTYRYRLLTREFDSPFQRGRALHVPFALDRSALSGCAAMLAGTHDFTAFTPTQTEHVHFHRRVTRAEWIEVEDDLIDFEIEADAFMRHMVRTLVGTMLAVGAGRTSAERFALLLEGRPRSEAGKTAAAHGLYLLAVRYPRRGFGFAGIYPH